MPSVKLEFYENGKIKSYKISSLFFMKFKDKISYNNKDGFNEKEI